MKKKHEKNFSRWKITADEVRELEEVLGKKWWKQLDNMTYAEIKAVIEKIADAWLGRPMEHNGEDILTTTVNVEHIKAKLLEDPAIVFELELPGGRSMERTYTD